MAIKGPKGAAAMLKLHPSTLRFRMKKLGLTKALSYTPQPEKIKITLGGRGKRVEGSCRGGESRVSSVESNPNLPSLAQTYSTLISLHSSRLSSFDLRSLAFHSSLDAACSLVPRHLSLATRYCFIISPSDN